MASGGEIDVIEQSNFNAEKPGYKKNKILDFIAYSVYLGAAVRGGLHKLQDL